MFVRQNPYSFGNWIHACVYLVSMCVIVRACVCVCVYVCVYANTYVNMYVNIYFNMCVDKCTRANQIRETVPGSLISEYVHVCLQYVCAHVYTCVHM